MDNLDSWKTRTMVIGIIAGAITGLAAAMIVIERATRERTTPQISAGDGVKLGLGVLGLMRLISDLGDRE
ncbi:MAG TPA: hypothetical protein VHO48_11565 [Anaerolineaceae bacterium]|nr:hypothetical protein [Anaerolineaceae bacterium]